MASEIGLLSVTQIQKLSQSQHHHLNQNQPHQPNPNSITIPTGTSPSSLSSTWMWNPSEHQEEEDDSWEVRAFAEDTKNIMGTTWPPRSYTCTFCRREFRSAQALGGHMNLHRRDRARLHHPPPPNPTTSSFINIPHQELVANDGLCFLYHLPSPNSAPFSTHNHSHNTNFNACGKSPSTTLLNVSSYPPNCWERGIHKAEEITQIKGKNKPFLLERRACEEQNTRQVNLMMMSAFSPSFDFQIASNGFSSSCHSGSSKAKEPTTSSTNDGHHEELDLELRLGHRTTPT